ncbi:MAG: four helix bundle protein [Chloroflexota bacterium]
MMNQQTDKPTNRTSYGASYTYRNLDVWERAQTLAVQVIPLARKLPRDPGMAEIARQLVGSSGSIGANIAEGHGRFTRRAYANHLNIAKGSASEVGSWLDLLRRLGEIDGVLESQLQLEVDSLSGLLKHKIRTLLAEDSKAKPTSIRESSANYGTSDDDDTPVEDF